MFLSVISLIQCQTFFREYSKLCLSFIVENWQLYFFLISDWSSFCYVSSAGLNSLSLKSVFKVRTLWNKALFCRLDNTSFVTFSSPTKKWEVNALPWYIPFLMEDKKSFSSMADFQNFCLNVLCQVYIPFSRPFYIEPTNIVNVNDVIQRVSGPCLCHEQEDSLLQPVTHRSCRQGTGKGQSIANCLRLS